MATSSRQKIERMEMSDEEIESLLQKTASALNKEEHAKLQHLIETLKYITNELDKKRVSIKRLKEMLFGPSSEKTNKLNLEALLKKAKQAENELNAQEADNQVQDKASSNDSKNEPPLKSKGHGRRSAAEYSGGEQIHISHPTIKNKSLCPKCDKGKLYLQNRPKILVRLTGSAPIRAKVITCDWLRCNLCGYIVTAPIPSEFGPMEKFDESVTSTVGLMRYGFGMPFNRLARMQENIHIPLPASTQWDLVNHGAKHLEPVFYVLLREAAKGEVLYNDDTTARILELMSHGKVNPDANGRTGVFTTGVISTLANRKVALYLTGRNHAGENLATVLAECEARAGPIIHMSDGLNRNTPTYLPEGLATIEANCMAHGRRKYVEIADSFPEQCLHVLKELEKVYKNDALIRKEKMNSQERLVYHQQHSRLIMDDLQKWLVAQTEEKLVEPNSLFGEASQYMLKRWDRLTRFLSVVSAPLDNNICERALKRSIRHRKNSLFYKTLHGARVGDIFMSLIHTCELNGVNPFDYLTELIRQGERLTDAPEKWLPWNYLQKNATEN